MSRVVTARACTNIALAKYWGKQGPGNAPATPSISLSLAKLTTTAIVRCIDAERDEVILPAELDTAAARQRVTEYIHYWRELKLLEGRFRVETRSSFPAAAGLASSASAFAAIATALREFSNKRITTTRLSKLARNGSGSAARSITGGISTLPAGDDPAARQLVAPTDVPWGMVVAQVTAQQKHTLSRAGMEHCRRTSPYYSSWVEQAGRDYRRMLKAVSNKNLGLAGTIMEANTLAMHAAMLASRPALMYWEPATIAMFKLATKLRDSGIAVYATADAGANVALLCQQTDMKKIAARARKVTGVQKVYTSGPGGPAEVVAG